MPQETGADIPPDNRETKPTESPTYPPEAEMFPIVMKPAHRWKRVNWPALIFGALATVALAFSGWVFFLAPPDEPGREDEPRFVVPASPTPSVTPSALPAATSTTRASRLSFQEPTGTPTPVPGGRVLVLTPVAQDAGWVVSDDESVVTIYDPQNHFGDSYLYAGTLDGKTYHAAFQFDLARILPGTKIYGAGLRLTGLRSDQLDKARAGEWRLQLLSSDIDYYWRTTNYQQLHNASVQATFGPSLNQADLDKGSVNLFEFTSEQLAFLEVRLNSIDPSGRKVSFRIDGPLEGGDNLFAWDSGNGPASEDAGPELFLSLGPPPLETPTPYFVIITSTPTPENILTAVAEARRMTAEATRIGTATPLPPHWVTPDVVTATPTAENQATAQAMGLWATATALAGGLPPNVQTATPTPTYVIITSTPTPESVMTAAAAVLQMTAEATRLGTVTPLPTNWVTPVVVTSTPTPANSATIEYWGAVMLTTGTPTATPVNVQTATPTPIFIVLDGELPTPALTPTPTGTPGFIPPELVGKIAFLSDRAHHTNAGTQRVEGEEGLPLGDPLVYVIDPDGSNLALLTDRWPYDLAIGRDAFSADQRFRAFVKDAIVDTGWTSGGEVVPVQLRVPAIFFYDFFYEAEEQITRFGVDGNHRPLAYEPAWSPTAEEIAFVSNESGNDEIWVINRDGSDVRRLTTDEYSWWDKHPSWSPDGAKIVFWSNRTGNRSIWVMDADGGNLYCLSRTGFNDWDPVWIKYTDPPRPLDGE